MQFFPKTSLCKRPASPGKAPGLPFPQSPSADGIVPNCSGTRHCGFPPDFSPPSVLPSLRIRPEAPTECTPHPRQAAFPLFPPSAPETMCPPQFPCRYPEYSFPERGLAIWTENPLPRSAAAEFQTFRNALMPEKHMP